jgi:hypothetical protein
VEDGPGQIFQSSDSTKPTFATQHARILAQEGDDGRNTLINDPHIGAGVFLLGKLDGKESTDPRGRKDQTLPTGVSLPV